MVRFGSSVAVKLSLIAPMRSDAFPVDRSSRRDAACGELSRVPRQEGEAASVKAEVDDCGDQATQQHEQDRRGEPPDRGIQGGLDHLMHKIPQKLPLLIVHGSS
jgi:hypothetical protein